MKVKVIRQCRLVLEIHIGTNYVHVMDETRRVETHFALGLASNHQAHRSILIPSVRFANTGKVDRSAEDEQKHSGFAAIRLKVRTIMSVSPARLSDSFVSGGSMSAETNLLTQINMPVWPVRATLIILCVSNRERWAGRFCAILSVWNC